MLNVDEIFGVFCKGVDIIVVILSLLYFEEYIFFSRLTMS